MVRLTNPHAGHIHPFARGYAVGSFVRDSLRLKGSRSPFPPARKMSSPTAQGVFAHVWREIVKHGPMAFKMGCLVNVIHNYGAHVTMCLGPSMLPTLNRSGDFVLVEQLSVMADNIRRGDIVISKSPTNPRHTVCKRVLGRGGDVIAVPKAGSFGGTQRVEVPSGHLWLQGDNKDNSTDSRDYGPVPYGMLRGKVFLKLWPMSEVGVVKSERWRSVLTE